MSKSPRDQPRVETERPRLIALVLGAGVLCVGGELVARLTLGQPLVAGVRPMGLVAAVAATAALIAIGTAVLGRVRPGLAMVAAFVALLVGAHVHKMQTLGKPLMPWDLLQARQVVSLFPTLLNDLSSVAILVGVVLAIGWAVFASLRSGSVRLSPGRRVGYAVAAVSWLSLLMLHRDLPRVELAFAKVGLMNAFWDHHENLSRNGLLLSTVMNVRSLFVRMPGYSREAVEEAMRMPDQSPPPPTTPGGDVVVWMFESMFDPTELPSVTFSRDPMPNMRALMREHTSGELVSPTYGGGTANVEFEVLTGLTTSFLPEGAYPYQHYVEAPLESLASVFKAHGYRTLGVHNFHDWYWQRDKVYPLLGFDRFIAQEELQAPNDGPYPSDEPLVDRVLAELDASSQPAFVYAVTMVSHGPFVRERKEVPLVEVTSGLEGRSKRELTSFASALFKGDRALGRLVDALKHRKDPISLVVFGDHLPALGDDRSLYREVGYLRGEGSPEDAVRMGTVPVLIWSNRPAPRRKIHHGMSALGPEILRSAGLEPQGWFARVEQLAKDAPVVNAEVVCVGEGRCAADPPTPEAAEARRILQLISYDRLVGERFSLAPERVAGP